MTKSSLIIDSNSIFHELRQRDGSPRLDYRQLPSKIASVLQLEWESKTVLVAKKNKGSYKSFISMLESFGYEVLEYDPEMQESSITMNLVSQSMRGSNITFVTANERLKPVLNKVPMLLITFNRLDFGDLPYPVVPMQEEWLWTPQNA